MIRQNIQQYHKTVDMPGSWTFKTPDTLEMINSYYAGRFTSGRYDRNGFRKFFFNVVKPAVELGDKFVDLDTKDIILKPEVNDRENELKVYVMRKRLDAWLEEKNIARLVDEMRHSYVKFGHVVIKRVEKGEWKKVNMENLRYDPTVKNLEDSMFVAEVHRMTRAEIKDKNWDNQENINELFNRGKQHTYLVYEYYTQNEDGKWDREIVADVWAKKQDGSVVRNSETIVGEGSDEYLPPLTLDEKKGLDFPYRDVKFEHFPGRYLGFGFVEYLEDNQVAINEAENLERKGLMFKALQLWQSRDKTVGQDNVLTDAENGDILTIDSEINPIQKDNSDLTAFNNTRDRWRKNTQNKSKSFDISTGRSLPSRTRVGVASLSAQAVDSFFSMKRERFGNFLRNWITQDVLPDFERDTIEKHSVVFNQSDKQIAKVRKAVIESKVAKARAEHMQETGFAPSDSQIQRFRENIRNEIENERNIQFEVPEGMYKDAQYTLDVVTTGEQVDVGKRQQVIQTALQIFGSNPQIVENDRTRSAFFKLLNLGGISPVELDMVEEDQQNRNQKNQQSRRQQLAQQLQQIAGQTNRGGSVPQTPANTNPAAQISEIAQRQ